MKKLRQVIPDKSAGVRSPKVEDYFRNELGDQVHGVVTTQGRYEVNVSMNRLNGTLTPEEARRLCALLQRALSGKVVTR